MIFRRMKHVKMTKHSTISFFLFSFTGPIPLQNFTDYTYVYDMDFTYQSETKSLL